MVQGNNQPQTRMKSNKKPILLTIQSAVLFSSYYAYFVRLNQ